MIEEVVLYKPRKASRRPKNRPRTRVLLKKRKVPRKLPKATQIKKLKAELWELCKQITRKRYGNTCFTCGKTGLAGSNLQTGHFIPRSVCGLYLKYDLRNLRIQDYRCNINLSGNGAVFYRNLVNAEGQEYVDGIFADKGKIVKGDVPFFAEKVAEYRQILESVENSTRLLDKC